MGSLGLLLVMKTYTNNTFLGHYPVGSAAVVRANNAEEAAFALNAVLVTQHLKGDVKATDMHEFPQTPGEQVRLLHDGNY